jgi:hypothetical protein
MVEKIEGWKDTSERYVAFLDIMGFKDRLLRDGHEKVKDMFRKLKRTTKLINHEAINENLRYVFKSQLKNDTISISSYIHPITFSDSIIVISRDDTETSAYCITVFLASILSTAFKRAIPMKGAIACGQMTVNISESIYFGQPLIDAFELQQELQLYGVVLHHTCEERINNPKYFQDPNLISFRGKNLIKYHVPMKSGEIEHYVLDWVYPYQNESIPVYKEEGNDPLDPINELCNHVSGKPRIYVDNTLKYIHWVKTQKEKKG